MHTSVEALRTARERADQADGEADLREDDRRETRSAVCGPRSERGDTEGHDEDAHRAADRDDGERERDDECERDRELRDAEDDAGRRVAKQTRAAGLPDERGEPAEPDDP